MKSLLNITSLHSCQGYQKEINIVGTMLAHLTFEEGNCGAVCGGDCGSTCGGWLKIEWGG